MILLRFVLLLLLVIAIIFLELMVILVLVNVIFLEFLLVAEYPAVDFMLFTIHFEFFVTLADKVVVIIIKSMFFKFYFYF